MSLDMQNLTLLLEGSAGLKFARAKLLKPFRRDVVGKAEQNANMEQHQLFSSFVGFDGQQWASPTHPKPDIWVPRGARIYLEANEQIGRLYAQNIAIRCAS